MDKVSELLPFMSDFLKRFNYPLVDSMHEDDIANVFSRSNRCFLITWVLKLLDDEYEQVLGQENDKELLGNLVYEHGFCLKKEKTSFMVGDSVDLPVDRQLTILHRIFKFVKDVKDSTATTAQNRYIVTNENLIKLKNTNLNLFPMYGDIKLLSDREKRSRTENFKAKLDEANLPVIEKPESFCVNDREEIFTIIQKLRDCFPEIRCLIQSISREKKIHTRESINLQPNFNEVLKDCSKYSALLSQYLKDVKTIEKFEPGTLFFGNHINTFEEVYKLLKTLAEGIS